MAALPIAAISAAGCTCAVVEGPVELLVCIEGLLDGHLLGLSVACIGYASCWICLGNLDQLALYCDKTDARHWHGGVLLTKHARIPVSSTARQTPSNPADEGNIGSRRHVVPLLNLSHGEFSGDVAIIFFIVGFKRPYRATRSAVQIHVFSESSHEVLDEMDMSIDQARNDNWMLKVYHASFCGQRC